MSAIITCDSLRQAVNCGKKLKSGSGIAVVCDERFTMILADMQPFGVAGGEECKSLQEVTRLWEWLEERHATRDTLMLIIGGGAVTDMAGFAAACFKRGIETAYIPTTLLSAVDAAIGGKTAINFAGLKNEIGAFHMPQAVIMVPQLWETLSAKEMASGYGELLKTAFLRSAEAAADALRIGLDLADGGCIEGGMVADCARFKQQIVSEDPLDKGVRQQLNLGHTFGHALETLTRRRGGHITHGGAVAIGLIVTLVVSTQKLDLESVWTQRTATVVKTLYAPSEWCYTDFDELYELMLHDKKNHNSGQVSMVLLEAPGRPILDCTVSREELRAAFEIADCYLH